MQQSVIPMLLLESKKNIGEFRSQNEIRLPTCETPSTHLSVLNEASNRSTSAYLFSFCPSFAENSHSPWICYDVNPVVKKSMWFVNYKR